MEDGFKAIAEIPYWSTLLKTYKTASEVGTLEFLLLKGTPALEVCGWSSTGDNAVGLENIIMEYAPGVPAAKVCARSLRIPSREICGRS
jgi:hypothetical protein